MVNDSEIFREEVAALDKLFDLLAGVRHSINGTKPHLLDAGVTDTDAFESHVTMMKHALNALELFTARWRYQRVIALRERGEEI